MNYIKPMITLEYAEFEELKKLEKYKSALVDCAKSFKYIGVSNVPNIAGNYTEPLPPFKFKEILDKYKIEITN